MKYRVRILVVWVLTMIFISGCTFRSNQLNFLVSLLPINGEGGPVASWYLSSDKIYELVYPINTEAEVWFANKEGLFIRFDGWNIIEAQKISSELANVKIDSVVDKKYYFFKGENEVVASCSEWNRSSTSYAEMIIYEENCIFEGQVFSNRITVNSEGAIVEIRFILHPEKDYFFLRPI